MDRITVWTSYLPKVEKAIESIGEKEDVRQEAQLGVWMAIISYDPALGDLDRWLTIQMWNAIKQYIRKERRIYERIRYDGFCEDISE